MKPIVKLIIAVLFLFICIFHSACKKDESSGVQFTIQVDSIVHSDTISVGDALEIKFYGLIGETKCFSFYKFDVSFNADEINIKAIGLDSENEDCEDAEINLNGEAVGIYELPEGDFTILVEQQRGNELESKVYVVP